MNIRLGRYYIQDVDGNIAKTKTPICVLHEGTERVLNPMEFAEIEDLLDQPGSPWKRHPDFNRMFQAFGPDEKYDAPFAGTLLSAEAGPSAADSAEGANGGNSQSFVTARAHSVPAFKNALFEVIMANHIGFDSKSVAASTEEIARLAKEINPKVAMPKDRSRETLVHFYLDKCFYYPVTRPAVTSRLIAFAKKSGMVLDARPRVEALKVVAVRDSIRRFRLMAAAVMKGAPKFTVGFSDDTPANVNAIVKGLSDMDLTGVTVYVYDTSGGKKRRVHVTGQ